MHRVDGQHPDIHYEEDTFKVLDEMGPAFDTRTNVYIVVVDNSNNLIGNGGVYSGGAGSRRGKNDGVGLFPAASVASGSWELAAHELGPTTMPTSCPMEHGDPCRRATRNSWRPIPISAPRREGRAPHRSS